MSKIKVQVIPPGVTSNPNNGILIGEKIKTSDVINTLKLLDNLYVSDTFTRKKPLPYCSCKLDKSERAHDHVKLEVATVNKSGLCDNCNHEVIWSDNDLTKRVRKKS